MNESEWGRVPLKKGSATCSCTKSIHLGLTGVTGLEDPKRDDALIDLFFPLVNHLPLWLCLSRVEQHKQRSFAWTATPGAILQALGFLLTRLWSPGGHLKGVVEAIAALHISTWQHSVCFCGYLVRDLLAGLFNRFGLYTKLHGPPLLRRSKLPPCDSSDSI